MRRQTKTRNRKELRSELDFFVDFYDIAALKDSDPLAKAIWDSAVSGVGISDDEMQRLLKNRNVPFDVPTGV